MGWLLSVPRNPVGATAMPGGTTPSRPSTSSAPAPPIAKQAPPPPPIAWINDLPKEIQDQIDNFSAEFLAKHTPAEVRDQRAANRVTFMGTMEWLFGSDENVEAHFREIKPMANAPKASGKPWAHVSTPERLL